MKELDFNADRSAAIEYVADQIMLAESGDARAISYLEFLWDEDYELLRLASDYLQAVELGAYRE